MIISSSQFYFYNFFSTEHFLQFSVNVLRWGKKYFPSFRPYWSGSRSEIAINIEWDLTNNSFSFLHHKLDYRLQHHQDIRIEALLHCIFGWERQTSEVLVPIILFLAAIFLPGSCYAAKADYSSSKETEEQFSKFSKRSTLCAFLPVCKFQKNLHCKLLVSSKHFDLQLWRAT